MVALRIVAAAEPQASIAGACSLFLHDQLISLDSRVCIVRIFGCVADMGLN